jgi:outer membrane protein OmpA-like peptidoglycan-associated protein
MSKHSNSSRYASFLGYVICGLFIAAPVHANVVGPSTQNFNPTPGGVDFLTVHSSETLEPGIFNVGIFGNYAVNSLPIYNDGEQIQNRTNWNDSLLMTDFNVAMGIVKNLEVGFSYPRLLRQKIDTNAPRGQFASTGNTEWRFLTKYRFFGNSKSGYAAVLSSNVNRIVNDPYAGIGAKPTYNFELVGDWTKSGIAFGANVGYRWFQQGTQIPTVSIQPTDDQIIGSVAASYLIESLDSKLITEIFGSRPARSGQSSSSSRQASSLELIGGIKHDLTTNVAIHSGAGTELISGAASPDWRVYVGINVANGPVFGKKDRLVQRKRGKSKSTADDAPAQEQELESELEVVPGESVVSLGQVQFDFNSAETMVPGADEVLGVLNQHIMKPPVFKSLIVEGHTDSIGSKEFNATLSTKRANYIMKILIEKFHVDATKIKAVGFGEDRPIGDNGNFQGRQQNRRVEFRINR